MASAAKQNQKYWIYGNIICLYLLVGFYSIYMDNHKTQSPVLKLKCSWLIQKCLGETASPAYLGCISDGQNKIVDRCYGFVKSRLWKSKSKLGTRLLLDFCQKVDFKVDFTRL